MSAAAGATRTRAIVWRIFAIAAVSALGLAVARATVASQPAGIDADRGTIVRRDVPRAPTADSRQPDVAFDGTNYLAVWTDVRASSYDIYGARSSPAGTIIDPFGIPISSFGGSEDVPALAFGGTNYFVVWMDTRSGSLDLYGARVSSAGSVLDPFGILISASIGVHDRPAVAFDGTNYLVAWTDNRSGGDDIYAARITPAGVVLDTDGIALSTAASDQFS